MVQEFTTEVSAFYTRNVTYSSSINLTSTNSSGITDYESLKTATKWIWIVISPIIFVFGIVGNFGIFIVLFRMEKLKRITYKLLLVLAFSDSVVLVTGLSRGWIQNTFDIDVRKLSDVGCRINVFITYFSMHFSSWTLVCICLERFVKTKFPFQYNRTKFSLILNTVYGVFIFLSLGIDLPLIPINGLVIEGNETICTNTKPEFYRYEEKIFVFIDLVWLSLLPFCLMLIMNIFIGGVLRNSSLLRESFIHNGGKGKCLRKSKRLTRMFYVTSFYFLITTLPIQIHFTVDSFIHKDDFTVSLLKLLRAVLYLFQFTNYAANFYIYAKVNKKFRRTLIAMFKKQRS